MPPSPPTRADGGWLRRYGLPAAILLVGVHVVVGQFKEDAALGVGQVLKLLELMRP